MKENIEREYERENIERENIERENMTERGQKLHLLSQILSFF